MMHALLLLTQVTVTGIGGIEASPREDKGIQAFMYGEGTIELQAGPVWSEIGGALFRFTGHEAKIPANPFNLEAGRYLVMNWFARGGFQHDRMRIGARFGRVASNALVPVSGRRWCREHRATDDCDLGYHAELVPYADVQFGAWAFEFQGPVLWRQGNTKPRSSVQGRIAVRLDPNIELGLYLTFPVPVLTGDSIVLKDGTVVNRVSTGELVPATADAYLARYTGPVRLAVHAGSRPHPAPGAADRYYRVAANVGFPVGLFRSRMRSVARER